MGSAAPRGRTAALCLAAVALAAPVLVGCSGPGVREDAAGRTAADFSRSAASDPSHACGLLTPAAREGVGEDCASSLADAGLPTATKDVPVVRSQVYGDNAVVELADDTVFLVRTAAGWRVTAAGCRSQGKDRPYDCAVEAP